VPHKESLRIRPALSLRKEGLKERPSDRKRALLKRRVFSHSGDRDGACTGYINDEVRPYMNTYSTLDVSRILGIEKSRVRDWIVKGYIIPSWHKAMARGDKNLLTYDDLCYIYLFQQLRSKGFHRTPIAFIVSEIAKTGFSNHLKSGFRYMVWNTRFPKEGGKVTILTKIPNSTIDSSNQMLVVDLLKVKNEVDRKRGKRESKRLPPAWCSSTIKGFADCVQPSF